MRRFRRGRFCQNAMEKRLVECLEANPKNFLSSNETSHPQSCFLPAFVGLWRWKQDGEVSLFGNEKEQPLRSLFFEVLPDMILPEIASVFLAFGSFVSTIGMLWLHPIVFGTVKETFVRVQTTLLRAAAKMDHKHPIQALRATRSNQAHKIVSSGTASLRKDSRHATAIIAERYETMYARRDTYDLTSAS